MKIEIISKNEIEEKINNKIRKEISILEREMNNWKKKLKKEIYDCLKEKE